MRLWSFESVPEISLPPYIVPHYDWGSLDSNPESLPWQALGWVAQLICVPGFFLSILSISGREWFGAHNVTSGKISGQVFVNKKELAKTPRISQHEKMLSIKSKKFTIWACSSAIRLFLMAANSSSPILIPLQRRQLTFLLKIVYHGLERIYG